MRLAFLFENYVVGGGSKYVVDCINGTLVAGHQVTLVSNRGALSDSELAQLAGPIAQRHVTIFERNQSTAHWFGETQVATLVRKALYFASPLLWLANLVSFWWHLGRLCPEAVIACNGGYPASEAVLAGIVASRMRKVPAALVFMSQPAPRRNSLPGYDRLLDRLTLGAVSKVVANSRGQAKSLVSLRGADASKVHVIYNGIPDVAYSRPASRRADPVSIGVVCRLDPLKGVDYLLRAFAALSQRHNLQLHIVGDGAERSVLAKLSEDLGIADKVIFHGHLQGPSISEVIDGLDVFVFPSLWEGLPYAILEAMRAGLPIVSTDVGGIPEAIGDRSEALLVPPRSAERLEAAIEELITNPDLASQLGQSARSGYEAAFSQSKMQQDFAALVGTMRTPQPSGPVTSK